jgi:Zn-dependent M16 (insulinase) family peptidase
MNLKKGDAIKGFVINQIRHSDSIGGTLVEMSHQKTGALLCWVDNKQENKLFSVAFKTTPENSTGVFHILEHSVLCGSTKYQVREPFVELLKSSMNTFLNAMTYPDKTVYPVSSRDEKDFLNLTKVYLDAVFEPLLTQKASIFHQEGWHYELGNETNCYNGVVLNEMKGAMSGVEERIEQGVLQLLFEDNCYKYNSGGDPAEITNLTYEQFVSTYKKYYHPSNARFYLDGDIPLETTLDLINQYLQKYEKMEVDTSIAKQLPKSNRQTIYYEVDEKKENTDILTFAKILCNYDDAEKIIATRVLCNFLAFSNESPLKKALISNDYCDDVDLYVNDEVFQPYLVLTVKNTRQELIDEIKKIAIDTVKDIVENKIDKEELTASLNKIEFETKQIPEPQALYRATNALASWLYGGDAMLYLDTNSIFKSVRAKIESEYFENLLSEIFIDSNGWSYLTTLPSTEIGKKEVNAESEKLNSELGAMSKAQLEKIKADNEKLKKWQQTPDSKEALESLPTLELSEINPTPEMIGTDVKNINGVKVLYHKVASNSVAHIAMYFPLTSLSLDEITLVAVLCELFCYLPTEKIGIVDLQREIKAYIGKIDFNVTAFSHKDNTQNCTPYLCAKISTLNENLEKAEGIIAQIINSTIFDDKNKIYEILKQLDEDNRRDAIGAGHMLGMFAVRSQYSSLSAIREAVNGYTFINTVHQLVQNYDSKFNDFIAVINKTVDLIGKNGAIISLTSDNELDLSPLINSLKDGKISPQTAEYKTNLPHKMGIKIPSQVAYAVKGYHLNNTNIANSGELKVVGNILTFSYLWNKVRVQGGAYGTGLSVARNGAYTCYSYRDPSPAKSLKAYDNAGKYLLNFANDDTEKLDNFIISSLSANNPLQSPIEKGLSADDYYLSGWNDDDRARYSNQILHTSRENLKTWCNALDEMAKNGAICVVAGEDALKEIDGLTIFEL